MLVKKHLYGAMIMKIIMDSNQYLEHCLLVMKADPNLSDETKIIMFLEFAKKYCEEKHHKKNIEKPH